MGSNPHYAHMFHLRRILPSKNGETEPTSSLVQNNVATLILLDAFVKFGRAEHCDIVLSSTIGVKNANSNTNMISREHAHISGIKSSSGKYERYMLTDQSLNGTYVNDYRCQHRRPVEIKEGDIIKFGHMNGASVKEGAHAPQANAEFAFMVERANPTLNYLGFRDGKRSLGLICRGENDYCEENEYITKMNGPPLMSHTGQAGIQLPTTTSATQLMNLFPNIYPFQLSNFPSIYGQQILQSGFRAPNIFAPFAQTNFAGLPATSTGSLLSRNIFQTNSFMNQLLNPVGIVPGAEQLLANNASLLNTARLAEEVKAAQAEKQPAVASPPMECDSSVPSPPKVSSASTVTPQLPSLISPKAKDDDIRSERSYADSPSIRRTMAAPAPWDSSPSPRPRDTPDTESIRDHDRETNTDTESRPDEVQKQPATSTSSSHKHRKNNEIARLLDDITESSFALQMRRTSTSRRPTEDERLEKNAKKEKKKKEKAEKNKVTPSSTSAAVKSRMKQLSDEESISSDSDSEPMRKELPLKSRKRNRTSESDAESDDSSKKKKKKGSVGRPKKNATAAKKPNPTKKDPKSRWKARAATEEEEEAISSAESIEASTTAATEAPCVEGICRRPFNFSHLQWVGCDVCESWFHTFCLFGKNDAYNEDGYMCDKCEAKVIREKEEKKKQKAKAK